MYRGNTTSTLKNLVIECMAMNLSEKEALEYLKDKGHNISHDTFYRHKRKIIESRFDRLGLIAKSQFVDQHLDRIANLELINKEMWSLYRHEKDNFKKVLITGSKNTNVHRVTFEGNKIAVFMTGSNGSTIEENFIGPNTIGVASQSSIGVQIHANMMTGNDLAGVTMVNTNRTQIDANSIGGSRNGIFLDYQSNKNTVENNTALKNDIDINNADGLPLNINGNELLKNICMIS